MWVRAYAWARYQIGSDLAKALGTAEWQRFSGYEELSAKVDGRQCKVLIRNFRADVIVTLEHDLIPQGLQLNESSIWGAQLQEAWVSGDAVRTGDLEFDLAFVVLGADVGVPPQAEKARMIAPEVRARLLALRPQLWSADIFFDHLRVPMIGGSDRRHNRPTTLQEHPFAWWLGRAFLGFGQMPQAKDLEVFLRRAVHMARELEQVAPPRAV